MTGHFRLAAVIGHRGVPSLAPENTLKGLRIAASVGFRWCEIDAQASSDGVAMVFHDMEPGRLWDGRVRDLPAAELGKVAVGKEHDTGADLFMPTLCDCLQQAGEDGLSLVVEIKTSPGRHQADTDAALRAILDCPRIGMIVSSFTPEVLALVAAAMPDMPLALNTVSLPHEPPPGFANVHFDARRAHPGEVARLLDAGLGLYSYTVNSASDRDRLYRMGVHGIFTDRAELLIANGD